MALKRQGKTNRVYCFVGDMAFRTGICHESMVYSISNDLPITFIIEDNGKSVGTPTQDCWGKITTFEMSIVYKELAKNSTVDVVHYGYTLTYPHSGTGVFVEF